jgi:hypothetical protein
MKRACPIVLLLATACSSNGSKGAPTASAAPSTIAFSGRPAAPQTGPSFLDDRPVPSAVPLPVASTPPGPAKASCDMRARRATCVDFYRPRPSDKSDCESPLAGGKYATSPCPPERSLGYCTTFDGDRRHYYDTPSSEGFGTGIDDAKLACESRQFTQSGSPPPPALPAAPSAAPSANAPK